MTQIANEKERYLSDFELFGRNGAAQPPAFIQPLREAAISRFADLSFPTTRDEEWRFTNVAPIVRTPFGSVLDEGVGRLTAVDLEPFTFGQSQWTRLVFVDGRYSPELSSISRLPRGLRVKNLAETTFEDAELIEEHLARYAPYSANAFTALNTAFIRDGALVHLADGAAVDEPIHLLFVATALLQMIAFYPRTLVVVGKGVRAKIVESYVASQQGRYFTNAVTEMVIGAGAAVDHYKLLQESESAFHVATTQVCQERDSAYTSFSFATGAEVARSDLNVSLDAEGAECTLNGLYLTTGSQHVDNHTTIEHLRPHGTSRELYKGILDGRSKAVFNGKIVVRPGALKTNAVQANRNLLLSDDARIHTKPELQIFADDVKCTHGATIGQLQDEQVFYLKARGIGEETARRLLTYGFASDVIGRIDVEPIRAHLDQRFLSSLVGG